jgi:hypothetical protein
MEHGITEEFGERDYKDDRITPEGAFRPEDRRTEKKEIRNREQGRPEDRKF